MKKSGVLSNNGVTLVELMVAMAVAGIVAVAIYTVYESQVRTQAAQEAALEVQQGMRGALMIMEREIRTAGADPTGSADAGVITAESGEFHFTRDIDDDAGSGRFDGSVSRPNEEIRYAINGDSLGRATGDDPNTLHSLLDHVDALNFVYLDRAGEVIEAPVTGADRNRIRQVEVTIVARASQSKRGLMWSHTDTILYENERGDEILAAQNDSYRRLRKSAAITSRNIGTGL